MRWPSSFNSRCSFVCASSRTAVSNSITPQVSAAKDRGRRGSGWQGVGVRCWSLARTCDQAEWPCCAEHSRRSIRGRLLVFHSLRSRAIYQRQGCLGCIYYAPPLAACHTHSLFETTFPGNGGLQAVSGPESGPAAEPIRRVHLPIPVRHALV